MIIFVALIVAVFVSVSSGYAEIPFNEIIWSVLYPQESNYSVTLFTIRLPRIILAVLCGFGLSLSGCILQTITKNPLADPGVLGINSGAGFMVMLFLSFFPALHTESVFFRPLFAMAGGLIVAVLLYSFAKRSGKLQTRYLLLGGIAISAFFSAVMLVMASDMENSIYQIVARWLSGNIWGASQYQVLVLLPYLVLLVPLLFSKANMMDLLLLGDEASLALGVQVEKERKILLVIAVVLAASCVSVSGSISFVGLVTPHIARRLVGGRHRILLPVSMLLGGLLLLVADTIGRSLFDSIEIPVGIVVSVLAAPYFLYLLRKQV